MDAEEYKYNISIEDRIKALEDWRDSSSVLSEGVVKPDGDYKAKLIAFCEGFEIGQVDELVEEEPELFRRLGKDIAIRIKAMRMAL